MANKDRIIDIPLDGVGKSGPTTACGKRSGIDIPLDNERTKKPVNTANISSLELEMVNRHHAEIKELHRRARQGEL